MGLGLRVVSSDSRDPSPPAKIITFMVLSPLLITVVCISFRCYEYATPHRESFGAGVEKSKRDLMSMREEAQRQMAIV